MHAPWARPHLGSTSHQPAPRSGKACRIKWFIVVVFTLDLLLLMAAAAHLIANRYQMRDEWWAVFDSGRVWSGRLDGSLAESFGDLQLAFVALVLLTWAFRNSHYQVYAAWGSLFLLTALEDHFRLRRLAGLSFSQYLQGSTGDVTATEAAAILGVMLLALLLGSWLVISHLRSPAPARRGSRWLLAAAVSFGFFAVGIDLLSNLVHGRPDEILYVVITYVETVGELLSMSFILAVALLFTVGRPSAG